MKINDAVARLVRAGDENSTMWQKVYEAIDGLAAFLARVYPGGGSCSCIASSARFTVWFRHWPSGQYKMVCEGSALPNEITLEESSKPREAVLEFCDLVRRQDLLSAISLKLENQTTLLGQSTKDLANFIGRQ